MTTLFQAVAAQLDEQAKTIDQEYRSRRAAILADKDLSEPGKLRQIADLDARRVSQVTKLQERAAVELADARKKHAAKVEAARAADVQRQRELLGDAVLIDIYRNQLRTMAGTDVFRMLQEAAPGWEHDVLTLLAGDAVMTRIKAGEQDTGLFRAHDMLAAANMGSELADLERGALDLGKAADEWVEQLDRDGYRNRMAATFRVSPEYMQLPDELVTA